MNAATTKPMYARKDQDIASEIRRNGPVGFIAMRDLERRISPHSIHVRREYRAELERIALDFGVPIRSELPIT